jgi:tetratricopeptide (TPR) repeat protein
MDRPRERTGPRPAAPVGPPGRGKPRDLIGDIHAAQRRKLLRRAAAMSTLAIVLLLIAFAVKLFADARDRARRIETARDQFELGTLEDVEAAAQTLEAALVDHAGDGALEAALAVVRAQAAAEYGADVSAAEAALAEAPESRDREMASALVAFARGEWEDGEAALGRLRAMAPDSGLAGADDAWLEAMLVIATTVDPNDPRLASSVQSLVAALERDPSRTSLRRALVTVYMAQANGKAALEELDRARNLAAEHVGLAADEALYNAMLRQRLGGVASVADQLVAMGERLSAPDLARARIARGVVHVYAGEIDEGLRLFETAYDDLPQWDRMTRMLVLEVSMEAGQGARVADWLDAARPTQVDRDVFAAWQELAKGDVMKALASLAALPQELPRVAYLQGLALVEQGRWAEASAWLERADKLLPGRVDVAVARARVEVHQGDVEVALRKLEGLAEEEPFAPRAWTGLGEAHLATLTRQEEKPANVDVVLRRAEKALAKAIEDEPVPAEALLRTGDVWLLRADKQPDAALEALEFYERAAAANPHLPRYRERVVLHRHSLGLDAEAAKDAQALADEVGVDGSIPLVAAQIELAALEHERIAGTPEVYANIEGWLTKAAEAGADAGLLLRTLARLALRRDDDAELVARQTELLAHVDAKPAEVESRVALIRVHAALGDKERAEGTLRRGLGVVPEKQQGRLWLEWGRLELRGGSPARAASYTKLGFTRMTSEEGVGAQELLDAGELAVRAAIRAKKPKPAMTVGRQLVERFPWLGRAWRIRAEILLAAKETAQALEAVTKAVELDPNDVRAQELLGNVNLRFGQRDKAKAAYEAALELAKGTPREDEVRSALSRL